ncbi:hypothetical protein ACH4FV_04240 [Streptomyces anulatus]|uniref:hypothetical protein n=1 Tax=Streptomyces TaxID=1883 RepID=UPI000BF14C64|nr:MULTISPECIES: hypothetical protein [unclassified Streptomyces]
MLPLISSHAQVYDREFRRRGVREQGWGRGMVAVAVLIWLWLAYQLFFSFSIEHGVRSEPIACDSRAFHRDASSDTSHTETERGRCAAERDWGPMLAAFLLSLPPAAVGVALYASGTSALRTADYAAEVTRLNAVKKS